MFKIATILNREDSVKLNTFFLFRMASQWVKLHIFPEHEKFCWVRLGLVRLALVRLALESITLEGPGLSCLP